MVENGNDTELATLLSHGGKTIEILNRDAEGRLVLTDKLTFAEKSETKIY